MEISGVLSAALLLTLLLNSSSHAAEFKLYFDPEDKYELSWSFDSTKPSDEVTFTIKCETTGWVGLGLSPNGAMTGADIVVMWIDGDGEAHIKDMHAISNDFPVLDGSQDYTLLSSSENNGISTFTFKRKINTCDSNDYKLSTDTTRLIYAYGDTDPANNEFSPSDKHQYNKKGARSVYLLEVQQAVHAVPEDSLTFDIIAHNYTIPAKETTYMCSFHFLPKLETAHHIIAVKPNIQKGNEAFVHHLIVYGCWGVDKAHLKHGTAFQGECYTPGMPEFEGSCTSAMVGWAVGGNGIYLPEDTGFRIGSGNSLSPDYFMMETHYDNQQVVRGQVDSSGVTIVYTPKLRKTDSGVVTIGSVIGLFVPPQVEEFENVAYCHSSCTNMWIPEEGVTIYGYLLHSHLLGVGIKIEHYRDNKPLAILAEDRHYNFNFQEQRMLKDRIKLMRGDSLKITCKYSSTGRQKLTIGGQGTYDEMCTGFIAYYPRQEIVICGSAPGFMVNKLDSLYSGLSLKPNETEYFGIKAIDAYGALKTVSTWTNEMVASAQTSYKKSYPIGACGKYSGSKVDGIDIFDPAPFTSIEMQESNDTCIDYSTKGISSSAQLQVCITAMLPCLMFVLR